MTPEQEVFYIHEILEHMRQSGTDFYLYYNQGITYSSDDIAPLSRTMLEKGLVEDVGTKKINFRFSSKGRDIAYGPGGYKGYLEAQLIEQQWRLANEQEDRNLARISALSTQDAAESAKQSTEYARVATKWGRASGIAALVATALSIITAAVQWAQSHASDARVEALEQQVQVLQQQLNQLPTTSPSGVRPTPMSPALIAPK